MIDNTCVKTLAAIAAAAATGGLIALGVAGPALASTSGTGAGIGAEPVCSSRPLLPGHASQLETGAETAGVQVTNTGTDAENLSLAVTPVAPGQQLHGHGLAVPPSWVSFGYPRHLLVLGSSSVELGPGASARIPVTVTVPGGARRGVYVADLVATTGSRTGGVQFAAGAGTYLIFTVGETRPPWPPILMASTGTCWALPGWYVPWQQWAGTRFADPPPGWHWQGPVSGVPALGWVYTPPPGWYMDWLNPNDPHQAYRGGPAIPCIDAAGWQDPRAPGGSWVGGPGHPDTSTAAGCAAWLAASAHGALTAEPSLPGPPSAAAPSPEPVQVAAKSQANYRSAPFEVAVVAALVLVAVLSLAGITRWRRRRPPRRQR